MRAWSTSRSAGATLGVALLCAVAAPAPARSQEAGRAPFALLGPEQGVPSSGVMSLAQDQDGFIWMATEGGLVRYEGGQHRTWDQTDGLPSSVTSKILASGGDIWVTTQRGLARFHQGRIETARLGVAQGTAASMVVADRAGRIWATAPPQLFRQRAGLDFEPVPLNGSPSALGPSARHGGVWVAAEGQVMLLPESGPPRRWGMADGVPERISLLIEDGQGRLWASGGKSLALLEPGAERFTDESARLPGLVSPNAVPLLDRDGSVWIPTQLGALHLGAGHDEVLGGAAGLPFRWVRAVFRDREGSLWVAGAGLARLQGEGRVRSFTLSNDATGVVVWYVNRDRGGGLLVGTDDGAARLGPAGLERIPGTAAQRIKGLLEDRTGTLWMISTITPALWLPPGAAEATPAPLGALGQPLNSVFEDSQGRLWFGHGTRGVVRWDAAAGRPVEEAGPARFGLQTLMAWDFREDQDGRLWVGSSAGLLIREPSGDWRLHEGGVLGEAGVRDFALLPDGTAWLNHHEPRGLTHVRLAGGKLEQLERRSQGNGLRSNLLYAVRADAAGHVWVTSDQGLDRLEPPLHVGRHQGMVSEDCSVLALRVEEGAVWVGHAAGLTRVDTRGAEVLAAPPRAFVLAAQIGSRTLEPPFAALGPIPEREATVELRIASPSYLSEPDLRLQVRMAGLEEEWRETTSRLVRYPALPGGRYRFEVRAANGPGPFGAAAGLDLVVLPPWWKTWWATALGLCGIAGLAAGLSLLRVAALARSKAALEELVRTRTGELLARNHELSAALSEVKELSGLLPICMHCSKVRNDSGYWQKIEQYISAHTKANFSHGLCPECYTKHYPE